MSDPRWRIREGSAIALQRIEEKEFRTLEELMERMFEHLNLLERRAFVAALAHPPILKDDRVVAFSLKLSEYILNDIVADP